MVGLSFDSRGAVEFGGGVEGVRISGTARGPGHAPALRVATVPGPCLSAPRGMDGARRRGRRAEGQGRRARPRPGPAPSAPSSRPGAEPPLPFLPLSANPSAGLRRPDTCGRRVSDQGLRHRRLGRPADARGWSMTSGQGGKNFPGAAGRRAPPAPAVSSLVANAAPPASSTSPLES